MNFSSLKDHLIIKFFTLALGILTSYFLYDLFTERLKSTLEQEVQLESQRNLGSLSLEIERRKNTLSILDSYFRSTDAVDNVQFSSFLKGLQNTAGLEAVCWRSTDLASEFRVGQTSLCDYFSFAEQDKIITSDSLLMASSYTQTNGQQQGFITIFISLQNLLLSLPEQAKYRDSLVIFNNNSQQFVRVHRSDNGANQSSFDAVDLTQTDPIARIGDGEVFYLMDLQSNSDTFISTTEITVTVLAFIAIVVTGLFLAHLLDVSQKVKTQVKEQTKSLVEATEQSNQMRKKAEMLAAHKQRFLANMSHEIRTPMNGVLGVVQLLEEESLSDKQREYVKLIGQSGNLMVDILNDILDQSKIDVGKIEIHYEPCNLKALLQQMCTMFESAALTKGIALKLLADPSIPQYIETDMMRLKQILSNLISNSLKFTHEGWVGITAKLFDEYIRITVSDTGIGISEDKLSTIFSEFTQADSSTTRNHGGTGLGLSISYNLLRLMDSELKVISTVGKGCSFFFDLPLKEASAPEIAQDDVFNTDENHSLDWPQDKPILVAEDNDINAMFITSMLEQWGINTVLAENGEIAVEKFSEFGFDIILMDCQMPVMDGLTATRQIRSIDKSQPFIVALTANALPEDREPVFRQVWMNLCLNL